MARVLLSERWFLPILETPVGTFTKYDIFNYYMHIKDALFRDLTRHKTPALIIRHIHPDEPFLQRRLSGQEKLKILRNVQDVSNPRDIAYWIERRTTEFHRTQPVMTDQVIVDIDPNGPVKREKFIDTVKKVESLIKKFPGVVSTEIRYSGGRGMYVIGHLKEKQNINKLREELKSYLKVLEDNVVTLSVPLPGQIRLDLSPMKRGGSIRALYSINADTGLVSVPVKKTELDTFNPLRDANLVKKVKTKYIPQRI